MKKKLTLSLILTLITLVSLTSIVHSLGNVGNIPLQSHVQNVTDDKVLDLSQYFTNDTTGYTNTCSSNLTITTSGSGHKTNYSYHPIANFLGQETCNITASNGTNSTIQSVTFNVVAQTPDLTLTVPTSTWIRTITTTFNADVKALNSGNVDLDTMSSTLTDLASTTNSSAKITMDTLTSPTTLQVGKDGNITASFSGLDSKQIGTYVGTLNSTYKSKFDTLTKTKQATIQFVVRDPIKTLTLPSKVILGASSKQARNANVTSTFEIVNSGDVDVSNLVITSNAASSFNVEFSLTNTSFAKNATIPLLTKGEKKTINIKGFIPASVSAGTDVDIGDILLKSSSLDKNLTIANFVVNTESQLEIERVTVEYIDSDNDEKSKNINSASDEIDKVKPDTKITFEVKVKNNFPSGEKIDIEDVEFEVIIKNIDEGSDVDDTSSEFDIEAGDSEKEKVTLKIPDTAEKGDYDVKIKVKGRQEKTKAIHTAELNFKLNIDRKQHDVVIQRAELENSVLSCSKGTELYVTIANQGRDDEDEAAITIVSNKLGISEKRTDIELTNDYKDDDSKYKVIIPIKLNDNIQPGDYVIRTTAYFSDDIIDDIKDVTLKVSECQLTRIDTTETKETKEEVEVKTTPEPTPIPIATPPKAQLLDETRSTSSFRDSGAYTALLILGLLVVLLTLAFLAFVYQR